MAVESIFSGWPHGLTHWPMMLMQSPKFMSGLFNCTIPLLISCLIFHYTHLKMVAEEKILLSYAIKCSRGRYSWLWNHTSSIIATELVCCLSHFKKKIKKLCLFIKCPLRDRVHVREIWQTLSNHPYLLKLHSRALGSCSKIFATFLPFWRRLSVYFSWNQCCICG